MYAVCFYLDCLSLSQMVKKKAVLFEDDLFLLQNLPIIARSLSESIPKILEKYFIFPIDNQRKPVIITRGLIL